MNQIERAIRAGAEAGKLREYIRKNGTGGLTGLIRLAEHRSAASADALRAAVADLRQ